jgi:hypothetical protein
MESAVVAMAELQDPLANPVDGTRGNVMMPEDRWRDHL